MNEQLLEDLRAVRELLSDPAHWTQDAHARTKSGAHVLSRSNAAVCWCLQGAAFRIARGSESERSTNLLAALVGALPGPVSIPGFNDAATHADVLALIDNAIGRVAS